MVKRLERKVVSFIAKHRQGVSAKKWATEDPEVLRQSRALGYFGEEEDALDIWQAMESEDPDQVRRSLKAGANASQRDGSGVRATAVRTPLRDALA